MYQLCLGTETFSALLDRIAERACGITPGLSFDACRNLVDLVFRARVRKTDACGRHPECVPKGSIWGTHAPRVGGSCDWEDLDPLGLPAMFATAATDLADTPERHRHEVEVRLGREIQSILSELLFCNPSCGRAEVCRAEPLFPLRTR